MERNAEALGTLLTPDFQSIGGTGITSGMTTEKAGYVALFNSRPDLFYERKPVHVCLTKAMVVDTGDRVWSAIANKPLDQINLSPERRELLREAIFIKPLPNVRRVVFIATPHRGSYRRYPPPAHCRQQQ